MHKSLWKGNQDQIEQEEDLEEEEAVSLEEDSMVDTYANGGSYKTQEGHAQGHQTEDCSKSTDGLTDSSREEASFARFKDTYSCMTIMILDEETLEEYGFGQPETLKETIIRGNHDDAPPNASPPSGRGKS